MASRVASLYLIRDVRNKVAKLMKIIPENLNKLSKSADRRKHIKFISETSQFQVLEIILENF